MTEYYIYSHKHTKEIVRTFWKGNSNGYTLDLNQAGKYTQTEVDEMPYPVWDDKNKKTLIALINEGHDTIAIPTLQIQYLGAPMNCILN